MNNHRDKTFSQPPAPHVCSHSTSLHHPYPPPKSRLTYIPGWAFLFSTQSSYPTPIPHTTSHSHLLPSPPPHPPHTQADVHGV
jgi:hypothetical protein